MTWFSRESERGTKDRPIILRNGDGHPVLYECRGCRRWFAESWSEAVFRTMDCEPVVCAKCFQREEDVEWAAFEQDANEQWKAFE